GFARPGNRADIPAIVDCSIAAWSERLPDPSLLPAAEVLQAGWAQYFDSAPMPGRVALVATADDAVVGWLMSDVADDADLAHLRAVEILDITVHPNHRRQGHGSRLVHALADITRNQEMDALQMWCLASDPALASFLAAQGFAADGARRQLADLHDGEDSGAYEVRVLTDIRGERA
ncbi:MAG: hypothetical protein RL745_102, partial [Actinomycetota bacterium]